MTPSHLDPRPAALVWLVFLPTHSFIIIAQLTAWTPGKDLILIFKMPCAVRSIFRAGKGTCHQALQTGFSSWPPHAAREN